MALCSHDPFVMNHGNLRERLQLYGPSTLSDSELVAVVLGTGTPGRSAIELAATVVKHFAPLPRLATCPVSLLKTVGGVGPGKACRLSAAFELGRRATCVPLHSHTTVRDSREVYQAFHPVLSGALTERFISVGLNSRNRVVCEHVVALGSTTHCAVTPSDVFRPLLASGASRAIAVHNHPSGDPQPSPEDAEFTHRLVRAGELLGIPVVDHVIIADSGHYSFLDDGRLPGPS